MEVITNYKTLVLVFVIGILNLFCALNFDICHLHVGICRFSYSQDIKEPNAAGAFYPDDPAVLARMIDGFLEKAEPKSAQGDIFALISPHAGFGFSGQTASYGYKLIKDKPYKTVVVIAPSHQFAFTGASVYPKGVFRTPLGDLKIDEDFTRELLEKSPDIVFEPSAFEKEHAVEAQLPFLQKVLLDFKIVPIVVGDCSFSACKNLAKLLFEAIGSRKDVLIIASTDLYHGYDYEEAKVFDNLTIDCLKGMDAESLYYGIRENRFQLCGGFAVVVTLIVAEEFGYQKLEVLNYTNSALLKEKKIKGDWTVGYVSCAIAGQKTIISDLGGRNSQKGEKTMLNKEQRKRLLEIARTSVETYLKTGKKMQVTETDPVLLKQMGAFVTLRKNGQLRGCIGNLIGTEPLYLTVRDMAVEAAVEDSRFKAVDLSELKALEIEISVLSAMERVASIDKIELGRHGVLVRKGFQGGVFLPQVATETGWTKEEFLSSLCAHKAGLSADAWKDKATQIDIFTAEVFSERNY